MKMKRIALILAVILLFAVVLSGCGHNEGGRLAIVYNDGFVLIFCDNETGVEYMARAGAGICVMVNADGSPHIYRAEKDGG